jgi:hypothetical protein
MHIHVPKPLHGWKAIFNEIFVIVIGILIALGLEQAIESIHQRNLGREAQAEIDEEMNTNIQRLLVNKDQQPCMDKRLDEIEDLLIQWGEGKEFEPPIWVGSPSAQILVEQRWQTNVSSGRISYEAPEVLAMQSDFYTALRGLNAAGLENLHVWARLRMLEMGSRRLTLAQRPMLLESLQDARLATFAVNDIATQLVAHAKNTAIDSSVSRIHIQGSACIPLRTSREQAETMLKSDAVLSQ